MSDRISDVRRQFDQATAARLARLIEAYQDDPRSGVAQLVSTARARLARDERERKRTAALYRLEESLRREGHVIVAGVDEVGRGALAGPVTAAAVVLPAAPRIRGLDDSKRLTPERREQLATELHSVALCMSVAHVSSTEIDAIGIAAAVRRAMTNALAQLTSQPDHVVVDGLPVGVAEGETAVVKGDSKVASVAAASILAKVSRDALMISLAQRYPEYAFDVNKGYGTSDHVEAIARHGLTPLHRRSFSVPGGTLSLF